MKTEKLAEVTRGEVMESVHRGVIAVVDTQGEVIASLGDPQYRTYFRSAAKPIQALPIIESGAAVDYSFTLKDIAVIISSHNGEPEHCESVSDILEKIGLGEEYLRCGLRAPRHKLTNEGLMLEGVEPSPLHNECSGKHAGMLALARYLKQPLDDYYLPEHPVQQEMLQCIAEMADVQPEELALGLDGCNVPTCALSLEKMAYAYARLAMPTDLPEIRNTSCEIVKAAFMTYPFMIAGTERFTTDLLKVTGHKFIAKDGAEAVFCLGVPDEGWGIAIKIADGNDRAMPAVVLSVLEQLDLLTAKEKDMLSEYTKVFFHNACGEVTGEIRSVFTLKAAEK